MVQTVVAIGCACLLLPTGIAWANPPDAPSIFPAGGPKVVNHGRVIMELV